MGSEGLSFGAARLWAIEGGEVFGIACEAQHGAPNRAGEVDGIARLRAAAGRDRLAGRPPDCGKAETARALRRDRIPAEQRRAKGSERLM
jgi:hypothetical protein